MERGGTATAGGVYTTHGFAARPYILYIEINYIANAGSVYISTYVCISSVGMLSGYVR